MPSPAFNVSNLETTQAIIAAAEAAAAPVILQLSPGAIAYAGYRTLTRLVFDPRAARTPIVVHPRPLSRSRRRRAGHRRRLRLGHVRRLAPDDDENVADHEAARGGGAGRTAPRSKASSGSSAARRTRDPDEAVGDPDDPRARPPPSWPRPTSTCSRPTSATSIACPTTASGWTSTSSGRSPDATDRPIALHGGSGIDQAQLRAAIDGRHRQGQRLLAGDPRAGRRHPGDVGRTAPTSSTSVAISAPGASGSSRWRPRYLELTVRGRSGRRGRRAIQADRCPTAHVEAPE